LEGKSALRALREEMKNGVCSYLLTSIAQLVLQNGLAINQRLDLISQGAERLGQSLCQV